MAFSLSRTSVTPSGSVTAVGRASRRTPSRFYFRLIGASGLGTLVLEFTTQGSGAFSRVLRAPSSAGNYEVILRQKRGDDAWAQVDMKLLLVQGPGGTIPGPPNPPPPPTPDTTPPVISNVSASITSPTVAAVSWSLSEGGTGQVEYGPTTAYGSLSGLETGLLTFHSQTLSGLTPGQIYHYRVRSVDAAGNAAVSPDRVFTPTAIATLPGAPTGLVATGGPTTVGLAWVTPASDGGSAITGYKVYRNGALIATLGLVTSYSNGSLTNGIPYTYTVAAITAIGEGPQSASATATPAAGGDVDPPVISGVSATAPTTSGVTINWSVNEPADGQVEYGVTTLYGSLSAPELSLLMAHSQPLTGLLPGTTYHYRARSRDAAGNLRVDVDRTFTTAQTTPATPPAAIFGPGVAYETKANERIDTSDQAFSFECDHTGSMTKFAVNQRGGIGYSLGTGGTWRISLQSDAGGRPSGTILASKTVSPGNPGGNWEVKAHYTFDVAASVVQGTRYWLVAENVHASAAANYISFNLVLAWNPADTPRQPAFPDTFAVMRNTGGGWALQNGYLAVFDLEWADGHHQGNMYFAVILSEFGLISGASLMCRARFTIGGGTITVPGLWLQPRRQSGSSPLIVRLEQADGTLIESVSVSSASVTSLAADTEFGAVAWVWVPFVTPRTLTNGLTYNVRLSTAVGTQYSVMPLRSLDSDMAAWGGYHFLYGAGNGNGSSAQETTNGGSSYADLYAFDRVDFAYYFPVAA